MQSIQSVYHWASHVVQGWQNPGAEEAYASTKPLIDRYQQLAYKYPELSQPLKQSMQSLFSHECVDRHFDYSALNDESFSEVKEFVAYLKETSPTLTASVGALGRKDRALFDRIVFEELPPLGLVNKGSTCFIASTIQIVDTNLILRNYMLHHENNPIREAYTQFHNNRNEENLEFLYATLRVELTDQNHFSAKGTQGDAGELLAALFDEDKLPRIPLEGALTDQTVAFVQIPTVYPYVASPESIMAFFDANSNAITSLIVHQDSFAPFKAFGHHGHYLVAVKNPSSDQWYECSDNSITLIPEIENYVRTHKVTGMVLSSLQA